MNLHCLVGEILICELFTLPQLLYICILIIVFRSGISLFARQFVFISFVLL